MAFQYALQKIVDLKVHEKSLAEWKLSKAISHLADGKAELNLLKQERDRVQHMRDNVLKEVTVSHLQHMENYLSALNEKMKRKQHEILSAQSQVNDKQDELKNKMIDEKIWNQAREKAFDQYKKMLQKKEQSGIDDLVSSRNNLY